MDRALSPLGAASRGGVPNYRAVRQREMELKSQKSGDGFFRLIRLDAAGQGAAPCFLTVLRP